VYKVCFLSERNRKQEANEKARKEVRGEAKGNLSVTQFINQVLQVYVCWVEKGFSCFFSALDLS